MIEFPPVLLLTSDYLDSRHGGVESHIFYLGRTLRSLGYAAQVLRVSPEPSRSPAPDGLPLVVLPARRARLAGPVLCQLVPSPLGKELVRRIVQNLDARAVEKVVRRRFPNALIHQHDFLANIRLSRRLARTNPVIWTNHLGEFLLLRRRRSGVGLLRHLTRHYRFVFAPSKELGDLPWMADRVDYCPNGVDANLFNRVSQDERAELRRRLGWGETDLVALVPRRWAPTKGVLVAAQALRRLDGDRQVRAVFIGAGLSEYPDYSNQVMRELKDLKGQIEIVSSLGPNEMAERYQASDVTLIPSFLEATSLAALEAMACGSLVIASAVGGMPELVSDHETGLLVPPGDPEALAIALEAAAGMPTAARDAILANARSKVETRYSWLAVAKHVSHLYRQTLEYTEVVHA